MAQAAGRPEFAGMEEGVAEEAKEEAEDQEEAASSSNFVTLHGRARRRHRQWHVPGWCSGFGASHAVFPSFIGMPEWPAFMVGMDVKDSYAVAALVFDCSSGMCCACFPGCDAHGR